MARLLRKLCSTMLLHGRAGAGSGASETGGGGVTNGLLLSDGVSFLLLSDGSSVLLLS